MNLDFEYDPEKSRRNLDLHGLDFEEAQELWRVPHVFFPAKTIGGEERHIIVGELWGEVYVGIFTPRGSTIRLISCHRADERWIREYERNRYET